MLITALLLIAGPAMAQQEKVQEPADPQIGQAGKDVIWVPTEPLLIDKMLAMAGVTDKDFVVDLGSGDGRIVIAAAQRGAKALGVEYDEKLLAASRRNAAAAGVDGTVTFVREDFYQVDFSQATVLALFLLPTNLIQLRDKFVSMPPGTRIVINSFEIPDWSPDKTESIDVCDTWCSSHLWIVPAKAAGTWQLGAGRLQLHQSFQRVSGEMAVDGRNTSAAGTLAGDQIAFKIADVEYKGRVNGDTMEGTAVLDGKATSWQATRVR